MTTAETDTLTLLDVVVPGPFAGPLSYRTEDPSPPVGARVRVPLRNRSVIGLVTATRTTSVSDTEADRLKPIEEALDPTPLIDSHLLDIARWMSRYYLYDAHNAYLLALPATLRNGDTATLKSEPWLTLTTAGCHLEPERLKGHRQRALLNHLQQVRQSNTADLRAKGFTSPHWRALIKQRLADWLDPVELSTAPDGALREPALTLSDAQTEAVEAIRPDRFGVTLIEGVTGSGKTEVYLQAMQRTLAAGQRVLVLVPEIGLTPQTLERFKRRFSDPLVALHSGLTDKERHNAWLKAQSGAAAIIVGTRSAVLTPIPDLGLIVIDEEHDGSFKQQDTLRYHARDVAIYRARKLGIPITLGSATPSLESLHNAHNQRYHHIRLTERARGQRPDRVETIDMRRQQHLDGLSERLVHRIQDHLAHGNQVLVFLNRRGYAPSWFCGDCGWMADCPYCDARLTYHRTKHRMLCHHCGYQSPPPNQCPECHSSNLMPLGAGTERAEERLTALFADTPIIRFDRDVVASTGALDRQLDRARQAGPAILVGTQMLAKGHHFEGITLVAVVDMDAGLFSADFRARERMGQLLIQVAGRAGRGANAGEVVLQSWHPDHPFFEPLLVQDYPSFAAQLLDERRRSGLPPHGHLACLRADSAYPMRAEQLLGEMAERLLPQSGIRVFGPVPAILSRRAGKHRFVLLVNSPRRSLLHAALEPLTRDYPRQQRHVSWHLDIDPTDLM